MKMGETIQQQAYNRIKRHLEDAPLDELLISPKKRCFGLKSGATPCTDVVICKKVDSVPSECEFVDYVKNVLSKRTNSLANLKLNYKQGFKNSLRECIRANAKEAAAARRYTLTACRRRMGAEDELEFKVFEAQEEDAICSNQEATNQQSKEVLTGSVKFNTSPIIEVNVKDDRTITCNGQQVASKEDECCYDVFHADISPEFFNILGSIKRFDQKSGVSWRTAEEESDYSDDEENENAEGNSRTLYPDDSDVSSESSNDCYMRGQLQHMKLVDSNSNSEDSDGEPGGTKCEKVFQRSQRDNWFS